MAASAGGGSGPAANDRRDSWLRLRGRHGGDWYGRDRVSQGSQAGGWRLDVYGWGIGQGRPN